MDDEEVMKELEKALDVPFTFSRNCRSGLLKRCECWRCRGARGEPVTDATEQLAFQQAIQADDHFNNARALLRSAATHTPTREVE